MRWIISPYLFYLFWLPALYYPGLCKAQEVIPTSIPDQICKIPNDVTADSLVNFALSEYKRKFHKDSLPNSEAYFRIHYYDNSRGIKYDEAFKKCREHLTKKLGAGVFCNYVYVTMNSFYLNENEFILKYYFLLPKISWSNEQPNPWFDSSLHEIAIKYKMLIQKDGRLNIKYPDNVPDCHGLPDCGIKVTREDAYKIAREIGFAVLPPTCTSFNLQVEGVNWVLEKGDDMLTPLTCVHEIKINMQTGERSPMRTFIRINNNPGCPG